MSEYKQPERSLERRPPMKKKPPPEGHQAFLKAIESGKSIVTVLKTSGEIRKGRVKATDKYTISLTQTNADGSYQTYVIFKHCIEEFWTDPVDNPKAE